MNFINRYKKSDALNFFYTEQFVESNVNVIYSVGTTEKKGLITKTDLDGKLVWEREYFIKNTDIKFCKIVQVYNAKYGKIYVLHALINRIHHIAAIEPISGNIIWIKDLFWSEQSVTINLSSNSNTSSFFISISDNTDFSNLKNPVIVRFNNEGEIIKSVELIEDFSLQITTIKVFNNNIVIGGRKLKEDSLGYFCKLNFELDIIDSKTIVSDNTDIHDVEIVNSNLIYISGYHIASHNLFVSCFDFSKSNFSVKIIKETSNCASKLTKFSGGLYLLAYDNDNGFVSKLNYHLDVLWTKTISLKSGSNGIRNITQRNNRITFTCFNQIDGSLLVHTNLQFQTCQTKILDNIYLERVNFIFENSNIVPSNFDYKVSDIAIDKILNTEPEIIAHCEVKGDFGLGKNISLQSPNFILNTAGSMGLDGSSRGVHLRWNFAGALGEYHLPKGNYYSGQNFIFNKSNDFVKIYKTPYLPVATIINFSLPPDIINPFERFWVYKISGKQIFIHFKNNSKYDLVINQVNPMNNSMGFMQQYGDELIEVECKQHLFFAVKYNINGNSESGLKTENLSVEKNNITAPKITTLRKKINYNDFSNAKFFSENIRSVRYQTDICVVESIELEFYSDFLNEAIDSGSWFYINSFSLSLNDQLVLKELEPESGLVHGKWPRFNEEECVNINNYIDRWKGPTDDFDRNIKEIVSKFLGLSTNINNPNPKGIENVSFNLNIENSDGSIPEPSEDDYTQMPLLDILNIGAFDFHIARMLGLGTLDISEEARSGAKYVYLSEYTTFGDLEDGNGEQEVQHLSMCLPTGIDDERLPIPIDLSGYEPGIISQNDEEQPLYMTDAEGYTPDGKKRFVTLKIHPIHEEEIDKPFFWDYQIFNQSEYTFPIYAGLEYKMETQQNWIKPELNNDSNYQNVFQNGVGCNETIPMFVPEENNILYIHKQTESGKHQYLTYGVNIFSRTTISNSPPLEINTIIRPKNLLQPPHNISALLIRDEESLLLTSEEEQDRRDDINSTDKTLVRLTFDYNTNQELVTYQVEQNYVSVNDSTIESLMINSLPNNIYPDDKDIFAEEIEIFFRNQTPNFIEGKITGINNSPNPLNTMIAELTTGDLLQSSTGATLNPIIPTGKENNFIGARLINGTESYIIHEINNSSTYPVFKVLKNSELDDIQITNDGYFQVVENLQNTSSWNNPFSSTILNNPHDGIKIALGNNQWKLKREVIHLYDDFGVLTRTLEKSRGIWKNATITEHPEPVEAVTQPDGTVTYIEQFNGIYKLTFSGFQLNQHPQFSATQNSVEWFKGIVRLRTESSFQIKGERRTLEVMRIENIGNGNLVLYILDNTFPGYDAESNVLNAYDKIKTGTQEVNYYPGYKVYLYQKQNINLTEAGVLPQQDEGNKNSIFGLRSHDLTSGFTDYYSKMSIPAIMFAQEIVEPQQPEKPLGAAYATRPDFYGKSTYTFTTSFVAKPYSLQFLRSNDEVILSSLYSSETLNSIREALKAFGGNDEEYLKNRWDNFFDFEGHRTSSSGLYVEYPVDSPDKYALPIPDHQNLIASINEFINWHNQNNGSFPDVASITELPALNAVIIPVSSGIQENLYAIDFIEQTIMNTFVPLTEIPVIYKYIPPSNHIPVYKKQNIRDANGYMLDPEVLNSGFEMAPMAKRVSVNSNDVQFTDFTLDGTSKNVYFYSVREIGNQMKMGKMSEFLGPIKLVNTNPPEAPEIKRVIPILENKVLGIDPSVKLEINRYPEVQYIKKINLYRTNNNVNAISIRTMELIKTIDLEVEQIEGNDFWSITDNFSDLPEVPFSEPLFYRITVSRKVEYSEGGIQIIEYAPSNPSKIVGTTIVENYIPESPTLSCFSEPEENDYLNFVTISWNKTCYKGLYNLYKMNNQGNWEKIHQIQSNEEKIYVHLEQTILANPNLRILSDDGSKLYHHFKVIAENTAGMISNKENILTIYNEVTWEDIGGISSDGTNGMIIGRTFIIR